MRKLNKIAASAMAVVMAGSMMAGCSSSSSDTKATDGSSKAAESKDAGTKAPEESKEPAASTGKVLNIWCWNAEFATRMLLLPDYVANNKEQPLDGGKIGDVEVKFTQVNNQNNAYQDALDKALDKQESAAADEKIDIFLVEADYALKYVDDDATLNVYDFLSKDDTANQYKYTQEIMTDSNGVLKGVSWQGCPGLLFYNREIAKEVLGTDDPDEVQKYVSDWDKFQETAQKMADKNYLMESSVNDSYRVYSNNVSKKWVTDDVINIDDNLKAWAESSKKILDMKATKNDELWAGYNNAKEGGCFCVFGPAWLINFSLGYQGKDASAVEGKVDDDGKPVVYNESNVCNKGGWGACVGPQSFYWGGTWLCAANGTDNAAEITKIMKSLTCDESVMKKIVTDYDDFVNNQKAMEEMAKDTTYSSYVLGGMNPLGLYAEGAKKISLSNLTAYDQGCNEEFQNAMKAYFAGDATYDEAIEAFYKNITTKYPNLKKA